MDRTNIGGVPLPTLFFVNAFREGFCLVSITSVLLALSGCMPSGAEVSPSSPTVTPTSSALDKEALLEESIAVITHYNAAVAQVTADYSVDASVLSPYATEDAIAQMRSFQNELRAGGRRLAGSSEIRNAVVQDIDVPVGRYTVLTCEVMENLRVLDSSGNDITPESRESASTLQTILVGPIGQLRVERSLGWSGASVC